MSEQNNINYLWAELIVEELIRCGADYFCVSPGSRSTPLALTVARHPKARAMVHFDERGTAFHALGYATGSGKPAVVISTSGTATANILPAVIEASKKKLPLIILTADRPPELRQTGAHQTIDHQPNLFNDFVRWKCDLPCPSAEMAPSFVLTTIDQAVFRAAQSELKGPVHLNCPFREPLMPTESVTPFPEELQVWKTGGRPFTTYHAPRREAARLVEVIDLLRSTPETVLVAGKLATKEDQESVLQLAEHLGAPIFPDLTSGLRLGSDHPHVIHHIDQWLRAAGGTIPWEPKLIIHIGGRITSKVVNQWLAAHRTVSTVMVLNHPLRNDPGHQVTHRVQCATKLFCQMLMQALPAQKPGSDVAGMSDISNRIDQLIDEELGNDRLSEAVVARDLIEQLGEEDALFVGNSLPLRHLEQYGPISRFNGALATNRGASGIDGNIASAIGFAAAIEQPVTAFLGDLTALHDMNSLAMIKYLKQPFRLVILNNDGGGIFATLPLAQTQEHQQAITDFFLTPHGLRFEALATMFGMRYANPKSQEEFRSVMPGDQHQIIEVTTTITEHVNQQERIRNSIRKNLLTTHHEVTRSR